jgi:hypothetical protein
VPGGIQVTEHVPGKRGAIDGSRLKNGPAYHYAADDAFAKEGDLDDIRLQACFIAGMPRDATRVRLALLGKDVGPEYKEYILELFGIRTESPPMTDEELAARDGSAKYWYDHDPEPRYMDIWLARVRWAKTTAVYEEAWIQQHKGWSVSIRDISSKPGIARQRECLGLMKGDRLVLMGPKLLGKRGRPARLSDANEVESLKMAAYKIGRQKHPFSIMRLAKVTGMSRNTLKIFLTENPEEEKRIKDQHMRGRRDILNDPWGGLGPRDSS